MSFMDKLSSGIDVVAEKVEGNKYLRAITVSYTHLTLPTNREV